MKAKAVTPESASLFTSGEASRNGPAAPQAVVPGRKKLTSPTGMESFVIRDRLVSLVIFLAVWLSVAGVLIWCIPASAWLLKPQGLIMSLSVLGLIRYGWQGLHAVRAYGYRFVAFPRLRRAADRLAHKYPRRLFFIVPSYKEDPAVSSRCFESLIRECARLPSEVVVIASVGGDEEIATIEQAVRGCPEHDKVQMRFCLQHEGKRKAIADALRMIAADFGTVLEPGDLIALMDGDTALGTSVLERTLPFFVLKPQLGALTTDEHPWVFNSAFFERFFALKMMRRHHIMMSHSLSGRVLTLTGRFSVLRAHLAITDDFIGHVENDSINTWLHGKVRFLMGDDKSTMYALLKEGRETMYVPDAHIVCLEDRRGRVGLVSMLMRRWYGNMLRNNGRCLALGPRKIPAFIWLCLLDQRISMWTALVGPTAALLLALFISPYYLLFYAIWVILTRTVQLTLLAPYGHRYWPGHLPLLVFEQWWGAAIKVHCLFNLNRQVWQKSRQNAQVLAPPAPWARLRAVVKVVLFGVSMAAFVLAVGMWVGAFAFP
jgi:glycosyltransferase Alg8